MKAIRGAITVKENKVDDIKDASKELVSKIIKANNINEEDIVSIVFTATSDIDKTYPAAVIREMGYTKTPLMCYQEMNVENSLDKCIRTMVYCDCNRSLEDIEHVYLRKAKTLRPDLVD